MAGEVIDYYWTPWVNDSETEYYNNNSRFVCYSNYFNGGKDPDPDSIYYIQYHSRDANVYIVTDNGVEKYNSADSISTSRNLVMLDGGYIKNLDFSGRYYAGFIDGYIVQTAILSGGRIENATISDGSMIVLDDAVVDIGPETTGK